MARTALYGAPELPLQTDARLTATAVDVARTVAASTWRCAKSADEIRHRHVGHPLVDATEKYGAHFRTLSASASRAPQLIQAGSSGRFRVAMMGRTQAGKSTILEVLSGGNGARIGDGRQRYSRDVCAREIGSLDIELVDTPGVGAADGQADYDLAFAEVARADVVLWVVANESFQEQTAKALRLVATLGKPIVIVLNCRMNLARPYAMRDLVTDPEWVYREVADHLKIIERHLSSVGVTAVDRVAIHAQAAFRSFTLAGFPQLAASLRNVSRIDRLIDVLAAEAGKLAPQRRMMRTADGARVHAVDALAGLDAAIAEMSLWTTHQGTASEAIERRCCRLIDAFGETLEAGVRQTIDARASWHLQVDVESGRIEKRWEVEAQAIHSEVDEIFKTADRSLREVLAAELVDLDNEYSAVPPTADRMAPAPGFGSVWVNRAGKLGIALTVAGVGTAIGGPAGFVVGLGLGTLATFAASLWDRMFASKDEVLRKRQHHLERQVRPVLDEMRKHYLAQRDAQALLWREAISRAVSARADVLQSHEAARNAWAAERRTVLQTIHTIDAATVHALLGSLGLQRLQRQLIRATRLQGVAIAAEFDEPGFSEMALLPPGPTPEPLLATPPTQPRLPSSAAIPIAMALVPGALGISALDEGHCHVDLLDDDVPAGICAAWSGLASEHTRSHVVIQAVSTPRDKGDHYVENSAS